MKLKIETTTTQEKEIIIGFPTFTKIENRYYAVLNEDRVIVVYSYDNIIGNINERENINLAFEQGYELIENVEFENALNKVNLDTHKLTNKVLQDIANMEDENEQPTEEVGTEYDPENEIMN